jgi:hypothetical protein
MAKGWGSLGAFTKLRAATAKAPTAPGTTMPSSTTPSLNPSPQGVGKPQAHPPLPATRTPNPLGSSFTSPSMGEAGWGCGSPNPSAPALPPP